jgi:hypothetical protein
MIKFLAAGFIAFSLHTAPEVNWQEITTDFSHWSYHSQKETKDLQKTGHCFVWRPVDLPVHVKTPKKSKK